MGDGCSEQGKNAVARGLHEVPIVTMDRVHHQLQRGIDDGARLFRVERLHQLHPNRRQNRLLNNIF
jgi:hypothetical protein